MDEQREFTRFASACRTPFFRDLTDAIALDEHWKRTERLFEPGVMEKAAAKLEGQTGKPVDTASVQEFARLVAEERGFFAEPSD